MSSALEPALSCYEAKVRSGGRLGGGWEEAMVTAMRTGGRRRDSLEEDSIFSLGKILASPRYGQYPDLSDEEEEDQVFTDHHLSLPYDPLSLPTIRQVTPTRFILFSVTFYHQVPSSAPPVRILGPPSASQAATSGR